MILLNHLTVHVSNYVASRDWYVTNFGLRVEFENVESGFGGLEDDGGVELILVQHTMQDRDRDCAVTFQCDSPCQIRGTDGQRHSLHPRTEECALGLRIGTP